MWKGGCTQNHSCTTMLFIKLGAMNRGALNLSIWGQKIHKGEKNRTREIGREEDFTCIPQATAKRFTLCWYVLSLTFQGYCGNQKHQRRASIISRKLSCLPFILVPAALMYEEDLSWEMEKDNWLLVFQQGLNLASCSVSANCFYKLVLLLCHEAHKRKKKHFCF